MRPSRALLLDVARAILVATCLVLALHPAFALRHVIPLLDLRDLLHLRNAIDLRDLLDPLSATQLHPLRERLDLLAYAGPRWWVLTLAIHGLISRAPWSFALVAGIALTPVLTPFWSQDASPLRAMLLGVSVAAMLAHWRGEARDRRWREDVAWIAVGVMACVVAESLSFDAWIAFREPGVVVLARASYSVIAAYGITRFACAERGGFALVVAGAALGAVVALVQVVPVSLHAPTLGCMPIVHPLRFADDRELGIGAVIVALAAWASRPHALRRGGSGRSPDEARTLAT